MPRAGVLLLVLLLAGAAQRTPPESQDRPDVTLPSGKSQRQEILKADYEKSKADAAELVELAQDLQDELENSEYHVLDLRTLKKAEEIEKLAKRIKDRMKRHF